MNCLLVDDMPLAIASLTAEIEEHCPELNILGSAGGVLEAARLLKDMDVDLLFLDIEMNDGNGFDLLDIINTEKIKVIFTTGSKEYAIRAFEYAASDYLLKPVDGTRLKEAVQKVKDIDQQETIHKLKANNNISRESIILHTQEEIRVAKLEEIIRCESANNYTIFFFGDGQKLIVSKTLKEYEYVLGQSFMRVHQSHLINLHQVRSYIKTEGGYILMKDGTHVPVSVRKKPEVVERINAIT